MFKLDETLENDSAAWNFDFEFWPKQAADLLEQGEFSKVIEIFEKNLGQDASLLSGRIILAKALIGLGRLEEAADQLYQVLSIDPNNLVGLKALGDIHFCKGDIVSALANYSRVLEIDPECTGLRCNYEPKPETAPSILTMVKGPEVESGSVPASGAESVMQPEQINTRNPFSTETVADLYIKQGQPRLALEILRELSNESQDERLAEKIAAAEKIISQKERRDVEQSN
jgi:tetratricopeptide (TPR) repeat protein